MSTYQVPGYVATNADQLHEACWAEHKDGSLLLVARLTGDQVEYRAVDPGKRAIYAGTMSTAEFGRAFSSDGGDDAWTWHDKTPSPKALPAPSSYADDFVSAALKTAQQYSLEQLETVP